MGADTSPVYAPLLWSAQFALGCGSSEGGVYLLGELDAFGQGGVHLPVACNDVLSHFYLKLDIGLFFRWQN